MVLSLSHSVPLSLSLSLLVTLTSLSQSLRPTPLLASTSPAKPTPAPSCRSTPSPSPPSQHSPNADKPRFLCISWVSLSIQALGFSGFHCRSHHCLPQPIPLVFRRSDPSASDPLLFRRSDPHWQCPPHRSPTLWLVIFYFVCDWWFCLVWVEEKDWRFRLVVFFFFFLLWTGGGGCGCGWW